jgi:hypothetical protein
MFIKMVNLKSFVHHAQLYSKHTLITPINLVPNAFLFLGSDPA